MGHSSVTTTAGGTCNMAVVISLCSSCCTLHKLCEADVATFQTRKQFRPGGTRAGRGTGHRCGPKEA
eukprot:185499-Rhodomonas_salina.1